MFHVRCKIPKIVRKNFFRYNLLLIPVTIGNKMFSINLQYLFESRSISFGELRHRAAPITRDSTFFLVLFSGVYFEITFRDIWQDKIFKQKLISL